MTEQAFGCWVSGLPPSRPLADARESHTPWRMLRVRLKADGRIVEILPDGSEQPLPRRLAAIAEEMRRGRAGAGGAPSDADYARGIRARSGLTQAEFAARIGVPIETVRNWEQGKRSPRGPARALLKLIDKAPDVAFAVLGPAKAAEGDEGQPRSA
jgi:putative transcriptional regulator